MVIWSILDKINFILDRTGGPGLAGPEIPNFWAVERSSAARYSRASLFKNLSSLICLFILTIIFFSSDIVDFGTSNNDVLL